MTKISKAVVFYIGLLLFSVMIQSCCTEQYLITGNGELRAYQTDLTQIDTVNSEFILISYFESELVGMIDDLSFIQTSYATSCDYSFSNSLVKSSAELTLDKEIVFDGQAVSAGTNLIESTGIEFNTSQSFGAEMEIRFTQEFLDKVVFEKERYIFKVKVDTDNDLELEHELSLEMDL